MTEAVSYIQDTVKTKVFVQADSLKQITDSSLLLTKQSFDTNTAPQIAVTRPVKQVIVSDTVSVCRKIPYTSFSFYDSTNFDGGPGKNQADRFPYIFTNTIKEAREAKFAGLVNKLYPGQEIMQDEYHIDWIVPIILISALIVGIIKSVSGNFYRSIFRYVTFRGLTETSSRDTADLYKLPSTLFNLASFLSISMFGYLLTIYSAISVPGISGIATWAVCLGIVIGAVTLRHFTCLLAGNWSSQRELFTEYLKGIYEAYRIAGIYCLIIVILILYVPVIPDKIIFNAGFFGIGLIYLMRISRLMLNFINRHISLFYFILYLCALEILPVVVLVKYVTGLV